MTIMEDYFSYRNFLYLRLDGKCTMQEDCVVLHSKKVVESHTFAVASVQPIVISFPVSAVVLTVW